MPSVCSAGRTGAGSSIGLRRGQVGQLGLDRGADPVAVFGCELLEGIDVAAERITRRAELRDFRLDAAALALGDPARGRLGFAHQRLGFGFRLAHQLRRPGLRFGDGFVGRLLRQDQRALDDIAVGHRDRGRHGLRRRRGRGLWSRLRCRAGSRLGRTRGEPLLEDADLMLEMLDRRGSALEQLVDLIPVVSAK